MKTITYRLAVRASNKHQWNLALVLWGINKTFFSGYRTESYLKIVEALERKGKSDEAYASICDAVKRHHDNPELLEKAASMAYDKKNYKSSKVFLLSLIRVDRSRSNSKHWIKLARSMIKIGETEEAQKKLEEALASKQNDFKALAIEYISNSLRLDRPKDAQKYAKLLISESNDDLSQIELSKLARVLRLSGDIEDAQRVLSINNLHLTEVELIHEAAEVYTANKMWSKALIYWKDLERIATKPRHSSLKTYARTQIAAIETIKKISKYRLRIAQYNKRKKPGEIAVVTCYTKGYDLLKPPLYLDDSFDYFVYTDDNTDSLDIYSVLPLPFTKLDNARNIRYVKTHPHIIASDYKIVIWIDSNLVIGGDIGSILRKFINSGKAIGSIRHPIRNDIYEEAEACIALNKGNVDEIKSQIKHYKYRGFVSKGHFENGILLFNLQHHKIKDILEAWWNQIKKYSSRDQLSFMFANQLFEEDPFVIMDRPFNVRNNSKFYYTPHGLDDTAFVEILDLLVTKRRT